ncbi:methyltransferase family protein [Sphingomonas morindae]|uniref:Protein-S-isoprenylcysteine methyltransferase n=1 Tax=Sphingomonas morindae TaxID=1541170 RepID=A0ABY4XB33_9SPHN|nr:isoprenylcysteine carboxylmethyltransferase family protein [Sphingomonas morindae]USI74123.1 protein-S-isoprenylcysteine methyltransferase [Sphingomonas morindae]
MLLWSLLVDRVHRLPETGIIWGGAGRSWREDCAGAATKLAALWTFWGLIALCYFAGRWYWQPPYLAAMQLLMRVAGPLLLLSIPYLLLLERRLIAPRDELWQAGRLILGRDWDRPGAHAALAAQARAWAVKGFFLAFMLAIVPGNWGQVMALAPAAWRDSSVALAEGLIAIMFLIDVMLATVGYALTLRPLASHIRSANPYAAGWTAALICYPPFVLMTAGGPLDYGPGLGHYDRWLAGHPLLLALNAFALIALTACYAWATIAFGLRFSNLTHRGILTHGPYRWLRHPAYVSKNLFWWLSAWPFLAASGVWSDAVRNTLLLALVSLVYFWRARTEERHLGADPAYRAYSAWIARHGLFARRGA